MPSANCKSCRYFNDLGMMGQCRRYPTFQNRHNTEWCGEHAFAPADIEEPAPKRRGRPAKEVSNDSTPA
jgi:hypothetical protein